MDVFHILLLMCAGALGGAANAIAGGGTFFSFPALLAAGVPPVSANATNSFAIWPGDTIALFSYRDELGKHRANLPWLLSAGLLGGGLGGWLLVQSTDRSFMSLVPVPMLAATAAFAFKARMLALIRCFLAHSHHSHRILIISGTISWPHAWVTLLGAIVGAISVVVTRVASRKSGWNALSSAWVAC